MVDGLLDYKDDDFSEMIEHLKGLGESYTILLLNGKNSDSKLNTVPASFAGIENFKVDNTTLLFNEIADLRVIKTPMEQGNFIKIDHYSQNFKLKYLMKDETILSLLQMY